MFALIERCIWHFHLGKQCIDSVWNIKVTARHITEHKTNELELLHCKKLHDWTFSLDCNKLGNVYSIKERMPEKAKINIAQYDAIMIYDSSNQRWHLMNQNSNGAILRNYRFIASITLACISILAHMDFTSHGTSLCEFVCTIESEPRALPTPWLWTLN